MHQLKRTRAALEALRWTALAAAGITYCWLAGYYGPQLGQVLLDSMLAGLAITVGGPGLVLIWYCAYRHFRLPR